jgi:hypothetical protein
MSRLPVEASPRSVGLWLRNSGGTIPGYWRVLTVDGEVPDALHRWGGGPLDALTARELLRREGGSGLMPTGAPAANGSRLPTTYGFRTVEAFLRSDWVGLPPSASATEATRPGDVRLGCTVRVRQESSPEEIAWKLVNPGDGLRK